MKTQGQRTVALRVRLNRTKIATAGINGPHVVSAIVHSAIVDRDRSRKSSRRTSVQHDLRLGVSGLISSTGEHVRWASLKLKVGDRVSIEVVEASSVDAPQVESPAFAQKVEKTYRTIAKRFARATPSKSRNK